MPATITTAPADAADVEQLRHEVEALRARVIALESNISPLASKDASGKPSRADDAAFLLQLARTTNGCAFSVAELRAQAAIDPALAEHVRGSNKQLGKRLRALAGCRVGAFVLDRVGRDGGGAIWIVQVLDDLHEPASRARRL